MWINQYSFVKTIQKSVITNTFQHWKTSGFPGNSILLARNFITIIQNTLQIYVFEIIHASTYGFHALINKSLFRKYRIFWVFTKLYKPFYHNISYELTNISYVDVFSK